MIGGMAYDLEARVHFHQKMRDPLERCPPPGVDGMFCTGNCLLDCEPAQRESELWTPVTEIHLGVDRANLEFQVGHRHDRIAGFFEKAAGQSNHVAGQHKVDDLPLAVAEEFVTRRKA